ncbi:hypothetical protein O6H91_21G006100 [Diphasiastrum complanatum]|uniref:Uncharacterized protein n=1 Tax=Diphasiastrum complanatum TaxID=34168 RepID=A0ACC2AHF9_DIPCM|nr:hypothetical protein O6H91_21G006100 [Diphasiastrum complanatum]
MGNAVYCCARSTAPSILLQNIAETFALQLDRILIPGSSYHLKVFKQYTVLGGCQGLLKGMATELASKGFVCVTFDMRGAGRSTGRASLTGSSEVHDVVAVCQWTAENIPASRILLVGSSAGRSFLAICEEFSCTTSQQSEWTYL